MFCSPKGAPRPHTDLINLETCLAQTVGKSFIRSGRPYAQHALRPECREDHIQSIQTVKPVIALTGQSLRTIINVEQNCIVGMKFGFYNPCNVNLTYFYPLILKRISGQTPKSIMAFSNLKKLCEEHLKGKYRIEVIDLMKDPQLAKGDQILALPTLVRKLPVPIRKIIGDLSNTERVLVGLDLKPGK